MWTNPMLMVGFEVLNGVPFEKIHWNPNSQYQRMWPYWERESLYGNEVKMRSWGWVLIQWLVQRRNLETEMRRPCEDGGLRDGLQTKEFQRLQQIPRGSEEERKDFPTAFRGSMALDNTVIPELWEDRFLLFWGTQLMYFVTGALGIWWVRVREALHTWVIKE